MGVLTLIALARNVGLTLDVEAGDRLIVKGPKSAADLVGELGERKSEVVAALRLERISAPAITPGVRFCDELACWPLAWREVWGRVTNALEDAYKAESLPFGGAELAAFAAVSRVRGEGLPLSDALTSIWDALGLPGSPPVLESERDLTGEEFSSIENRPPGSPTWGVTKSIRVVELASWSPNRQDKDPVIKVAAEG